MDHASLLPDEQARTLGRLIDQSAQPFGAVDLDGRFARINRAFADLLGYSLEEIPRLAIADITPDRWRAAGREALATVLNTGKATRYEKEYRRKDGTLVPVEVAVDLDRDESGQPRGYFAFITDISERKAAERAVRVSEERFRRLYDEAPVGYHEIDLEGTIVSINRTECEMLGYAREDMIGRPVFDFLTPEHRDSAREAVREKIAGKRPLQPIERPYLTRDGHRLIMAIEERYRLDDDGRIIGLRTTIQDITERKRTEAALVASERRNRALFEGIEDAVFVHDSDGRLLDANPAACRRLGYSRDELLTLTTRDVDDSDFAAGFEDRLKGQLEHGHMSFEGRHKSKNGQTFPVEINTSTIVFENRRAVLAVIRDITERKALEETRRRFAESQTRAAEAIEAKNRELIASEAKYRKLTEGAHDAVVVADSLSRITLFNPAAERTFGYQADEVIGQPLTVLMPEEMRPLHEKGLHRYVETGVARIVGKTVEIEGLRKSGERFPLELSLSAFDLDGQTQFIGSIRDQTERQRLRAMLVQSEKLASIGLLSAGVAHEINNPLAYVANNIAVLERDLKGVLAMMGAYESARPSMAESAPEALAQVDALSEDLDWPYVRDNLDRMISRTRDGIHRVATIVQNLRGLARTSPPKLEPALLRDLVAPAVEMVQGRGKRRNIEVIVEDLTPVRVPCVTSQISQVILNLLVNALQAVESANRPEGGHVVVSTKATEDEVSIAIRDDGLGIAPEDLPRLFDPFFTTKAVGEGTGLGLSISHGIITGHGGRIDVASEPGRGTTFTIVLPRRPIRPG